MATVPWPPPLVRGLLLCSLLGIALERPHPPDAIFSVLSNGPAEPLA
ncbi:MAG: hypothetical protein ACKOPS_18970 [Cyanobium sp.]